VSLYTYLFIVEISHLRAQEWDLAWGRRLEPPTPCSSWSPPKFSPYFSTTTKEEKKVEEERRKEEEEQNEPSKFSL